MGDHEKSGVGSARPEVEEEGKAAELRHDGTTTFLSHRPNHRERIPSGPHEQLPSPPVPSSQMAACSDELTTQLHGVQVEPK